MNVLAVVAHPDDEVLGCGGTLAKHAEVGDGVYVTFLVARPGISSASALETLVGDEWKCANLGYADQSLDTAPLAKLAADIRAYDNRFNPADIIYTHHPGDLNQDHAQVARAVLTAFRPKPGEKPRTILACEVLSSTEWTFPQVFQPNWFESLDGPHLDKKIAAMMCYRSEVKSPRDGPGITTLASYRGNQCGAPYAEAFQLLRRGPC